jgi:DNA-binding FadR family transcriptional regulator
MKAKEEITVAPPWEVAATASDGSMVRQTVQRLIALSLAAEDGAYLGSEGELIERLSISRPTLRQAAKVVENDQLISVRRGVNGGFYAARPDARHVIKMPAMWLRLQSATLQQMNRASMLIFPETAAEASGCQDETLVAALRVFHDAVDERMRRGEGQRDTVRAEVYLSELIARMSGNPVLILFNDISYTFGLLGREFSFYRASIDRRQTWLSMQKAYCGAILSGDAEAARLLSQRRGHLIDTWITEDGAAAATAQPED